MTCRLVHASGQAVKLTFFAPCIDNRHVIRFSNIMNKKGPLIVCCDQDTQEYVMRTLYADTF